MIAKCRACDEEFDDKYYLQNNNKEGFRDILLTHLKRHDDDIKIRNNFTGVKFDQT